MVKEITIRQIEQLELQYYKLGGRVCMEAVPGTLGYGTTIMLADGYKTAVIREHHLNEWSCWHSIRFYNSHKLPKKYQRLVEDYDYIVEERGW